MTRWHCGVVVPVVDSIAACFSLGLGGCRYTKAIFDEEYALGCWVALWVPVWTSGTIVQKEESSKSLTDPEEIQAAETYLTSFKILTKAMTERNLAALVDENCAAALEQF